MIRKIICCTAIAVSLFCLDASGTTYSPELSEAIYELHTARRTNDAELIKRAHREAVDFSVIATIALGDFPELKHIDQHADLKKIGWDKTLLSIACGKFGTTISNYLRECEKEKFDYYNVVPPLEDFEQLALKDKALMGANEILSLLWMFIKMIEGRKEKADSPDYDETDLMEDTEFAIKSLISIQNMKYLQPDGYCEVWDEARNSIREMFFGPAPLRDA